ncbi:MAG: ribbon-helix-helix domain-containing protein [Actinomycetota bacterium]|nr:ribbon-helix-helix domain-containing protein [Actinomycetota bacterium]
MSRTNQTEKISVVVTPPQMAELEFVAEALDMSKSDVVRDAVRRGCAPAWRP